MNNFIFSYPTKVYFGKGCVKEYLASLLRGYGPTVMLAYGGGSLKKSGVYDQMISILAEAGKTVVEFGGIMPNPTYAKVQEGARLSAPVIFEDSSGCYPVCIKNPDIMDNTTASITGRSLFIIRA